MALLLARRDFRTVSGQLNTKPLSCFPNFLEKRNPLFFTRCPRPGQSPRLLTGWQAKQSFHILIKLVGASYCQHRLAFALPLYRRGKRGQPTHHIEHGVICLVDFRPCPQLIKKVTKRSYALRSLSHDRPPSPMLERNTNCTISLISVSKIIICVKF